MTKNVAQKKKSFAILLIYRVLQNSSCAQDRT